MSDTLTKETLRKGWEILMDGGVTPRYWWLFCRTCKDVRFYNNYKCTECGECNPRLTY